MGMMKYVISYVMKLLNILLQYNANIFRDVSKTIRRVIKHYNIDNKDLL